MKLKNYIVFALVMIISISLNAEPMTAQGKYGWKMLTIPTNPSTLAMAGTGASISSEASSFIMQPTAGLLNNNRLVSVSQMSWLFDTKINTVAINIPDGSRSYGFALRALDYGRFDARDITGDIIGEFHPLDVNLISNVAFRLTPDYYAGVNIYLLYQKIDTSSSIGIASDFGVTYLTPIDGLDINAALKHLGSTSTVKKERIKLPLSPEIAVSYKLPFTFTNTYTELKVLSHPDDDNLKAVLGAKIGVISALDVLAGYRVNYDSHTYSLGLGVNLGNIVFNYAYLPFKFANNDVHSFGLSYSY